MSDINDPVKFNNQMRLFTLNFDNKVVKATKLSKYFLNDKNYRKFNEKLEPVRYNKNLPYNKAELAENQIVEISNSDSSIDARIDGQIDHRGEPQGECYCSNPNFVRNCKKKLMKKELECSFCLSMYVKPVTLNCGHTFCKNCALNYFLKN